MIALINKIPASSKHFLLIIIAFFLNGCVASTQIIRGEQTEIKEYVELYFIPPKEDPRNIVPTVIEEFKSMGFNVRIVSSEKPIEGAQGTGFLISESGHILTCAHVIGEEKEATAWISGTRYEVDVLSKDKDKDIAILQLRKKGAPGIPPLSFSSKKSYSIGEDVFTIGFPMSNILGSSARLSKGLISSTSGLKDDPNQLQISAEIQPGNSGGPLFDKQGVILGVVQQTLNPWKMAEQTGGALPQNVNFAIKSEIITDYIKSSHSDIYQILSFNKSRGFEEIQKAVVKIRSGIIPEELENKPKLVAKLDYKSIWDVWYRFKYFVISVYDFDSQDLLFRTGQGYDNMISNEEVVIKDTFKQVRNTLNKDKNTSR